MGDKDEGLLTGTSLPLVEEFYSIQGEGFHTGKPAYFIRLGGCDIGCHWCDSRFAWDSELHAKIKTDLIIDNAKRSGTDSVVVTGGEPLMWNLDYLCKGLKKAGMKTFLETSGAYRLSGIWDWICLSPKRNMPPVSEIFNIADELKIIVEDATDFEWAENYRNRVKDKCCLFLQPEWSRYEIIISEIVEYVKRNPWWRISLQIHKFMHIP